MVCRAVTAAATVRAVGSMGSVSSTCNGCTAGQAITTALRVSLTPAAQHQRRAGRRRRTGRNCLHLCGALAGTQSSRTGRGLLRRGWRADPELCQLRLSTAARQQTVAHGAHKAAGVRVVGEGAPGHPHNQVARELAGGARVELDHVVWGHSPLVPLPERRQQLATQSRHHPRAIAASVDLGVVLEIQVQVARLVRTHHLIIVPELWPQPAVSPPEPIAGGDNEFASPTLRNLDGPDLLTPLVRLAERRLLKLVHPPAVLLGGPPFPDGNRHVPAAGAAGN
eukprot:scaffold9757_cov104-Isochrysis_galbana.AAC.3